MLSGGMVPSGSKRLLVSVGSKLQLEAGMVGNW